MTLFYKIKQYYQEWNTYQQNFIAFFISLMCLLSLNIIFYDSEASIDKISISNLAKSLLLQWVIFLTPIFFINKKNLLVYKKIKFNEVIKSLTRAVSNYLIYIGGGVLIALVYYLLKVTENENLLTENIAFENLNRTEIYLGAALICIIVPILEEIYFRGILLDSLLKKFSTNFSNFIIALIFSLIHFNFIALPFYLLISFLVNNLYIKQKNLLDPILLHIIFNSISYSILTLNL